MKILQIAGYKNSGKTTLAASLIQMLASEGVRVASLKHHGHGGAPSGLENTDSGLHQQAGAVIAGVEGDGVFQLAGQDSWHVDEMLAVYRLMNIETVIIEGFKRHDYDKVVLVRKEEDLHLLEELTHIKAVVAPQPFLQENCPFPVFNWSELDDLIEWVVLFLNKKGF